MNQDGVGLMGKTASKFCSTQAPSSLGFASINTLVTAL